jgi:hypothetical protein
MKAESKKRKIIKFHEKNVYVDEIVKDHQCGIRSNNSSYFHTCPGVSALAMYVIKGPFHCGEGGCAAKHYHSMWYASELSCI